MMIKATLSSKGELLIPKPLREELGFARNSTVFLEVKDKTLHVRAVEGDPFQRMEDLAKKVNADVSTWVYGDRLYEEEFGKKWEGKLVR